MAYEDFKGFRKRKASDKVLCDKTFNIAKNPKKGPKCLDSMVCKFFDEKSVASCTNISASNQQEQ